MKQEILIVDDESDIRKLICGILEDEGYETRMAWDLESVKLELVKRIPSLILLDVWLDKSNADGIDILKIIKKSYNNIPVVMISGHGTIDMAINAIKIGAFDFLEKPFETNVLIMSIKRAIEISELKKQNKKLIEGHDTNINYIGKSQSAVNIRSTIEKVSMTGSRILIQGPQGSGKKFLAQIIHNKSNRKDGPFVIVNTKRTIKEDLESYLFGVENKDGIVIKIGLIEQAHKGTLYIDEISNLNNDLQSRVVKLLTEKLIKRINGKYNIDIDVRIICGTSVNIHQEIISKRFREDLYYRLNVVPITIPPLNDRIDDIPEFIDYFVNVYCKKIGIAYKKMSKECCNYLQSRRWNGNLTELRNVVERILILAPKNDTEIVNIDVMNIDQSEQEEGFEALVKKKMHSLSLKKAREYFEKEYIKIQMNRFNNNVSRTANFIGMERSALHRKLKSLKLN